MSESADSAVVAGSLGLEGVWLHDPADPAGTALHLRYGRDMRSADLDVDAALSRYAGRTHPVASFGPHESESMPVQALVPHGPAWSATLAAVAALIRRRVPLVVRDNRGRNFLALVSGRNERDASHGTVVSFNADRVEVE